MKERKIIGVLAGIYKSGRLKYRPVRQQTYNYVNRTRRYDYFGIWKPCAPVDPEELRDLLRERVGKHKEALLVKVKELGCRGVSTMDEKHYRKFKRFLLTLTP